MIVFPHAAIIAATIKIRENNKNRKVIPNKQDHCGDCESFLGFGDFDLCCKKKSGLCYKDTLACELFKRKP